MSRRPNTALERTGIGGDADSACIVLRRLYPSLSLLPLDHQQPAMWIRRTTQEIAEAPAQRQRAEQRLRTSPITAFVAALVGFLFQVPGCSRDLYGNLLSWAESFG